MRLLGVVVIVAVTAAGCFGGNDHDLDPTQTFAFGPYHIEPGEEREDLCVQITLHNDEPLYVNTIELTTGPGFHHSNWFFVPERIYPGDDSTWGCAERNFSEPGAALAGGVIFAQSTQDEDEIQRLPKGKIIMVPPHSKLIASLHLLNATETAIDVAPHIALTPIPEGAVTTHLAAISFENQALALPANRASSFSTECPIDEKYRQVLGRPVDFKIYYALAHYHRLGTGLQLEAVRDDGTSVTIYSTASAVGDSLGGPLAPAFDMTGFAKLRMTCDYFNPRADVVGWGVGDQEMCVVLAFTDSELNWGGGITAPTAPLDPVESAGAVHYTNPCDLYAAGAVR